MRKLVIGLAAMTVGALAASGASADINDYKGAWVNVNPATGGVTKLRIIQTGGLIRIRAFGQCHPTDCDWGVVRGNPFSPSVGVNPFASTQALMAVFSPSFARKTMIIERVGGNQLRVKVLTNFVDGSGRNDFVATYLFRRQLVVGPVGPVGPVVPPLPPVGPVSEDCVGFNPATAMVKNVGGDWKLVDGSHWIKSFGTKAGEAFKALATIKAYHLNRICFVGRPNPSMEYFKRGNQLPVGGLPAEDCIAINPMAMTIKPIGGKFVLVEGNHMHKAFPNLAEATQGLRIMRMLGARQACYIGRPGPSMTYLKR